MKAKKLFSFILAMAMSGMPVANSIPLSRIIDSNIIVANAEDDNSEDVYIWDGTADTSWYDSEETELHIRTAEEFAGMAKLSNSGGIDFKGQSIYLDNDIYLNENDSTQNVWSSIIIFSGNFYGNNHTIFNLYAHEGVFKQISGTLDGLNIQNANITSNGTGAYGGICKYSKGNVLISNCNFNGKVSITTTDKADSVYFGGICGIANADNKELLKIEKCVVNADIVCSGYYVDSIGGLMGAGQSKNITINKCAMNGKLTVEKRDINDAGCVGGICGSGDSIKINCCVNNAEIDAKVKYTGGILGYGGSVNSSYNSGIINGLSKTAGIIGHYGSANYCYNTGIINNGDGYAIMYDYTISNEMKNLYFLNTSAAKGSSDGRVSAISKTEENMKKDSFALALGDDFVYVPGEYPKLKWEVGEDFKKFKKEQISFNEYGQSEKLELSTSYDGTINWVSDDPKIATVDENGNVTALANGITKIYAMCGDTQAVCAVNVDYGYNLNKSEVNLEEAATDSICLISKNTKEKFDTIKPVFKSSDEDIAIVDENGEITAIQAGQCVISAEIGDCKQQCNVSVYEPKKKPSFDKTTITIDKGKKDSINVLNYTGKVTWVSADTKVINVNSKDNSPTAEIEAVGEGKTTIYAMLSTGKNLACEVTVNPNKDSEVLAGDVNKDNIINLKDVVLIRRYIAGGWNAELNEEVADVNGDGAVNLKDVVLLRRYIAGGWGVTLKSSTKK